MSRSWIAYRSGYRSKSPFAHCRARRRASGFLSSLCCLPIPPKRWKAWPFFQVTGPDTSWQSTPRPTSQRRQSSGWIRRGVPCRVRRRHVSTGKILPSAWFSELGRKGMQPAIDIDPEREARRIHFNLRCDTINNRGSNWCFFGAFPSGRAAIRTLEAALKKRADGGVPILSVLKAIP